MTLVTFYSFVCVPFEYQNGAYDQSRTGDLILTKDVLYQLSYIGTIFSQIPDAPEHKECAILRIKTITITRVLRFVKRKTRKKCVFFRKRRFFAHPRPELSVRMTVFSALFLFAVAFQISPERVRDHVRAELESICPLLFGQTGTLPCVPDIALVIEHDPSSVIFDPESA